MPGPKKAVSAAWGGVLILMGIFGLAGAAWGLFGGPAADYPWWQVAALCAF